MSNISEEEKVKYRRGCLTGLAVVIAFIILSSGISQVTGYRTNVNKSVIFLHKYKEEFPKNAALNIKVIHVANNNFVTVKTNLSSSGEGVSAGIKIKDNVIAVAKKENMKIPGIKVLSKDNKSLYNTTTNNND